MARVPHTHKDTVMSDYNAAERPDPIEEEESTSSNPGEEAAEVSGRNKTSQNQSQ